MEVADQAMVTQVQVVSEAAVVVQLVVELALGESNMIYFYSGSYYGCIVPRQPKPTKAIDIKKIVGLR